MANKLNAYQLRLASGSPNDISLKMLQTRFICARKSWHVDHRGEIRCSVAWR